MAYIGKSIESGTFSVLDTSGNTYNGSNTTFSLGTQVGSVAQLLVSHDGVIQKPGTDYTLASGGTQITFTTAPASGASIFIVEISGAVGGPLDSDLNGAELILDADGDTTITADTDDQIDIKIAGADDFQFTANTFTAQSGSTIAGQAITATTIATTGAVTATVDGTGLKSVGTNAQVSADASSGYAALITDGAASQSSYVFFQTNGTDKARLTADSSGNFEIGSGGTTTGLKVDSAGHVTMPLQSAAIARTATQSNVTGDETQYTVTFAGSEVKDQNADFSSATFTAPSDGVYLAVYSVSISGLASNHTRALMYIVSSNRTYYVQSSNTANEKNSGGLIYNVSAIMDMDANDTVTHQLRVDGGSAVVDIDDIGSAGIIKIA